MKGVGEIGYVANGDKRAMALADLVGRVLDLREGEWLPPPIPATLQRAPAAPFDFALDRHPARPRWHVSSPWY